MRFFPILALAAVLTATSSLALAQSQLPDPFKSSGNSGSKGFTFGTEFGSRSRLPAPASKLSEIKLNDYDQEQFNACRQEASAAGTDIMQIRNANGFINAPYKNPVCTKLVVDKMLLSMDLAMKNDPEGLAEYQRDQTAQKRYEELKKAAMILNRNAPSAALNYSATQQKPATTNSMSANQFLSNPMPNIITAPEENLPTPKPAIPSEWWAKDYRQSDMERLRQRITARNESRHPTASNENESTPLQTIMMDAATKKQERDASAQARSRGAVPYR